MKFLGLDEALLILGFALLCAGGWCSSGGVLERCWALATASALARGGLCSFAVLASNGANFLWCNGIAPSGGGFFGYGANIVFAAALLSSLFEANVNVSDLGADLKLRRPIFAR